MIIVDENGVEIDTESKMYKQYLQCLEMDRLHPDIEEPTFGWLTLREVLELEKMRASAKVALAGNDVSRETPPATL